MRAKLTLAALCAAMLVAAHHFDAARERTVLGARDATGGGARLRLMTWNVGYAELEDDTRAHTSDLRAVADAILKNDPDAIALQELTGSDQLKVLLGYLGGRYRGAAARAAHTDRVEAVLVKSSGARFEDVPAGGRYAVAATFRPRADAPEVVLVSAHADAFRAARRREYTESIVDWARAHSGQTVFVAGDFNFELDARDESHLYTDDLKHDSEAYSYLLRYFRDAGREAGDTAINDRRIDYVFAPPAATTRRAEVLKDAPVGRMDHMPLVVEVGL
ncbi:MAG: endonuclease/exonuclease/phosphatase family protein [Acidobacteria bacterium]|nr:endonuclease/exonuclease/phosphatase family protein [Acidobacteriota bacterium]